MSGGDNEDGEIERKGTEGKEGRLALSLIPSPISLSRSSMVAHSIKSDNLEGGRESREGGRGEGNEVAPPAHK